MSNSSTNHFLTDDGTSTLHSTRFNTLYHSSFGALTESEHIFINAGVGALRKSPISLLEVGFGTGLNAALASTYAQTHGLSIYYHALDFYPLSKEEYSQLNYSNTLPINTSECWQRICEAQWEVEQRISNLFTILKTNVDFLAWTPSMKYDVVFFDAFAPNDQPEMWAPHLFEKLFEAMNVGGVLTTYCVKGAVKCALTNAGFRIERLPGPPGKRHILRAWREGKG